MEDVEYLLEQVRKSVTKKDEFAMLTKVTEIKEQLMEQGFLRPLHRISWSTRDDAKGIAVEKDDEASPGAWGRGEKGVSNVKSRDFVDSTNLSPYKISTGHGLKYSLSPSPCRTNSQPPVPRQERASRHSILNPYLVSNQIKMNNDALQHRDKDKYASYVPQ
ncbi:hypothetical protein GWI33_016303 [Rhynchophorus ferrugineus]|uniref:Uncharacterized protein n=1 Tax=Rhynchophorus ferrugineus TaxID=354439 RepID=A0A834M8S8_RHYFE|nr:hypothetical protein GWI33_016303 [Rhynchophorus ferrugineus]